MNSEYGLAMRVYGDGRIISESLGIDSNFMLWIGLGIGNALSAIAGALIAQISRDFNSGMGSGALVFGLAATIIGEKIMSSGTVKAAIFGCFIGSFVYKTMIGIAMFSGAEIVGSEYNSIITAVTLIFLTASINDSKRRVIHD
jgi:putative ABC transport system permease protein